MKITNNHDIDLPIAVWLLQDGYKSGADVAPKGELVSATTLLQPTRRLLLQRQVNWDNIESDISDRISARMGHALHDSIEQTWTKEDYRKGLRDLGYSDKIIDKIKINPNPDTVTKDDIPIYLEQRGFIEFEDIILTGQLDFAVNGNYIDLKSTSVYSYMNDNKAFDYSMQGSIYRLLMPNMIWKDTMRINFLFTDWQRRSAELQKGKGYPQSKAAYKEYPLFSVEETKQWVSNKLQEIRKNSKYINKQDKLIRCTDKELWMSKPKYKYYSDPTKANKPNSRASRVFSSMADAQLHLDNMNKGVIVEEKAEAKACEYCPAFPVCEQRREHFHD